ncbi:MAG: hypothetical protein AAGA31_04625, partial [Bacteroidota bacterium]
MSQNTFLSTIICLLVLAVSCKQEKEALSVDSISKLKVYFNSSKRAQRFSNEHFWARDTIANEIRNNYFKSSDNNNSVRLFRISSPKIKKDTNYAYFMYGLASSDNFLSQIRIRSFYREAPYY